MNEVSRQGERKEGEAVLCPLENWAQLENIFCVGFVLSTKHHSTWHCCVTGECNKGQINQLLPELLPLSPATQCAAPQAPFLVLVGSPRAAEWFPVICWGQPLS